MRILRRVLKALGAKKIECLLGGREFIGKPWFRFLIEENIPFIIRVKQSYMVKGIRKGHPVPIGELIKQKFFQKQRLTETSKIC